MVELKKKFKVVAKNGQLVFPVTPEGNNEVIYPAVDTEYAEFDTYQEAQQYISKKGYQPAHEL